MARLSDPTTTPLTAPHELLPLWGLYRLSAVTSTFLDARTLYHRARQTNQPGVFWELQKAQTPHHSVRKVSQPLPKSNHELTYLLHLLLRLVTPLIVGDLDPRPATCLQMCARYPCYPDLEVALLPPWVDLLKHPHQVFSLDISRWHHRSRHGFL